MIRFLHTGDWHIGQTLRGWARDAEFRAVLAELTAIAAQREADAMIVAGDVFDSQNPSGEAQRLFYDALAALHRACPRMTLLITAGNHDSPGRLAAPESLLQAFGVHVVGSVRRQEGSIDIAHHLIPLKDASGETAALALAVSYPTSACLPPFARLTDVEGSPVVHAVRKLYSDMFEAARPLCNGVPLIATGHLHIAGGLESEGAERRILVGGEHAAPPDIFPDDVAYVALGHLHKAQRVGRDAIRYSGSLLPLSATEQPYKHGVTLVTLADDSAITHEHIPLARPVDFLHIAEEGGVPLDTLGDRFTALALDPDLAMDRRPFVYVTLAREGLVPGFRAEAGRIAEMFPVRLVDLRVPPIPESLESQAPADPVRRLAEYDPAEMFRRAFERTHGVPPEASHLDVFHHAWTGG